MAKVSKEDTISDILKRKPEACNILMDYGLGCANCELGSVETLEEGCKGHGLADSEIISLIEKLEAL